MKKKIIGLIAGSSGDSLTDILHENNYEVAMVAGKENEPGTNLADTLLVTDLKNDVEIIDFFRKNEITKVIIGTGHSKAIDLSEKMERSGINTNIDYKNSVLAKDKIKFKKILQKNGFPTPEFIEIKKNNVLNTNTLNKVKLPSVVKSSTDTILPQKVDTVSELSDAIKEVSDTNADVLIEQYINGSDCTVAVRSNENDIESYGVIYWSKAKEWNLKGFKAANSDKLSSNLEEKIERMASELVEKLNITGLVRVDFIVEDTEIYILELNSVITTGYKAMLYPHFVKHNVNISRIMVENSLAILGE